MFHIFLLLVFTAVSCEDRIPYRTNELCDAYLNESYDNPFLSVVDGFILKGYCKSRSGWAFLQQKQDPGFGSYGGTLLSRNTKSLSLNTSFIQVDMKNKLFDELSQQIHGDQCISNEKISVDIITVASSLLYHSQDYREPTELSFFEGVNPETQELKFRRMTVSMGVNYRVSLLLHNQSRTTHYDLMLTQTPTGELYITSSIPRILPQKQHNGTIRLMSYNIQHFFRGWQTRAGMLRELIKKSSPDIIGFQEVRLDETQTQYESQHQLDHVKEILRGQGYEYYTFQPAMSYISTQDLYRFAFTTDIQPIRSEEGIAIFSKYPIVEHDYILLSRNIADQSSHQRVCLHAKIEIGSRVIDFYDTHLSLRDSSRQMNMQEILSFTSESTGDLKVLVGDYNSEPKEWTITMLEEQEWIDTHRVYCMEHANASSCVDDQPANTFSTDGHFYKRIDYIYVKEQDNVQVTVKDFQIIGSEKHASLFIDENGREHVIYASDHSGITTDLFLG